MNGALLRLGTRPAATCAHHLRGINETETSIRQHDEKFRAVRHEEKVIRRGNRQRASVREMNLERLEAGTIAQFLQRFQRHNARKLLRVTVAVNARINANAKLPPTCTGKYPRRDPHRPHDGECGV